MHFSTNPRGRGIKRKHSSPSAGGDAKKILGKLFHCLKEVKKAAKKAKAFETRKIVKRLKSSGKKSPDKGMLSKELDVLKTINHDQIGTLALRNKLKKDKFLSSEPSVQMAISEVLASDTIPASEGILAKLETRLLSSKPLSEGVTTAISSLYVALELKQDNGNGVEEGPSRPHKLPKVNIPAATEPQATLDLSEGTTQHSFVGSGSRRGTSVSRSVSVSDQELGNSGAPDINTSEDHDLLTNGHSPPHAGPDGPSRSLLANSIFLPALSNGFIPGSSDTDWSDGEERAADSVRKNRRGQRARRAIWEKKYGKRAKHLQKQEESGVTHGQHKSQEHAQGSHALQRSRLPVSVRRYARGDKTMDVTMKHLSRQRMSKAMDDRPLHPSWVAKRRMKERTSATIVPSEGKRIKFED